MILYSKCFNILYCINDFIGNKNYVFTNFTYYLIITFIYLLV